MTSLKDKLPEIDETKKKGAFDTTPAPKVKKVQPDDLEGGGGSMVMDSPEPKSDRVVKLNQTKEEQSLINVTADGLLEKDTKGKKPEKEENFFK